MSRILQQVRIIAPFTKGYAWATPVLAILWLAASFAESAAISLVTLFLYTAIGPGGDAPDSSGILQRVFAGARDITGDSPVRLAAVIGLLVLFKASPDQFVELGQAQVCAPNWCNPAYADGRLYLRDGNKGPGELKCVELTN